VSPRRPGPRRSRCLALCSCAVLAAPGVARAQDGPKIFISVDMEGIGGIGTGAMTSAGGKDYAMGRRLMTDEINAVVAAIFARGPAEVVVNDSHGDHQNLLHTELDPRVTYIQGSIKPLGMVQGLDDSYDAAMFIGYHAKAGDPSGFLAHTGTGSVKGLWLNGHEVGEAGMNAAFAGMHGVPVVLASGDSAFVAEVNGFLDAETVITKTAVTPSAARLKHPERVRDELTEAVGRGLDRLAAGTVRPWDIGAPVSVRMRFTSTTHVEILQSIPGMSKVDGFTVAYTARDADQAYRLIRLMYRFVQE
jgi:D-amino peptidase